MCDTCIIDVINIFTKCVRSLDVIYMCLPFVHFQVFLFVYAFKLIFRFKFEMKNDFFLFSKILTEAGMLRLTASVNINRSG